MIPPHAMRKGVWALGVLGLAGDLRAAARLPTVPTLQLVLLELESADQTAEVRRAEEEVAAAIRVLGGAAVVRPFPRPPQGLFVLHNRHKLRRSLIAIRIVQRDLRGLSGPRVAQARSNLGAAARAVENALLTPFLF